MCNLLYLFRRFAISPTHISPQRPYVSRGHCYAAGVSSLMWLHEAALMRRKCRNMPCIYADDYITLFQLLIKCHDILKPFVPQLLLKMIVGVVEHSEWRASVHSQHCKARWPHGLLRMCKLFFRTIKVDDIGGNGDGVIFEFKYSED